MSKPKFCTSCGAPVEPDQLFCTSCGAEIESDPSSVGIPQPPAEGRSFSSFSSDAGQTHRMPSSYAGSPSSTSPMPAVAGSSAKQYRQSSQQDTGSFSGGSNRNKTILIAVIAVLAVIVCILVGVLLGNALAGSSGQQTVSTDSSGMQSQSLSQSADASSNGGSPSSAEAKSTAELSLYNELNSYYSKLGNYDSQIASAATTFNSNYLKKDMSTRRSYAKEAESILAQVKSDYDALQSLSVTSSSANYSSYNTMVTCYNDCVQRISVICESWSNSLGYSDPSGHEDTICAPLSRDKVGDSNKYYTDFQQNYPNAKPVSPSS